MEHALDRVDQLAVTLQQLLPMSVENQRRLDKKFRLEFNYNSNHLEGNTLTYGETALLLIFDDTKGNHTMREYEEMKAHDVALQLVEEWAKEKERPLTEQHIKHLNEIILVRPFWKDAITADGQATRRQIKIGNYKEHPNSVRLANGEMFHYTTPAETPMAMDELLQWYRSEEGNIHPVTLAAMLHYKFVRIHPFDDGNGRVSRLLMNYVLLRNGLPPIIIPSADKHNYLAALHQADIGDYSEFINYIAQRCIASLALAIKAAKGESIEEKDDFEKELFLLEKKLAQKQGSVFSADAVWEMLREFYFPLVKQLTQSLAQADRFFSMRSSSSLISKNNDHSGVSLHFGEQDSNNPEVLAYVRQAKSVRFTYKLQGPKSENIKIAAWEVSLKIHFRETQYTVESKGFTKAYAYGNYPTTAEADAIVAAAKSNLLTALNNGI